MLATQTCAAGPPPRVPQILPGSRIPLTYRTYKVKVWFQTGVTVFFTTLQEPPNTGKFADEMPNTGAEIFGARQARTPRKQPFFKIKDHTNTYLDLNVCLLNVDLMTT